MSVWYWEWPYRNVLWGCQKGGTGRGLSWTAECYRNRNVSFVLSTLYVYLPRLLCTSYKRYGRINKELLFAKFFSIFQAIVYCAVYDWYFVFWNSRPNTIIQSKVACSYHLILETKFSRLSHERQRLITYKGLPARTAWNTTVSIYQRRARHQPPFPSHLEKCLGSYLWTITRSLAQNDDRRHDYIGMLHWA